MSQENLISTELPASVTADITEKLNAINTALAGILLFNLTGQDRLELYKLGDKSLAFVEKALEYAANNPTLVPSYLDLGEANKDLKLSKDLNNILKQVSTLQRAIEDTAMVAGSEAYDAALVFYASVKGANRVNVPGSQSVFEDLQKRYIAKSKKKEQTQ
ncbi:MAG TPA: hypothetical protein VFK73_06500 [Paludibacter sp.]|nr:hypothetical protein [Paludibacter sp.]